MISVYDIGNSNFQNNGDVVLTPLSAKVKLVAGGGYDITITHPIDPEGKWEHLAPGAIVKAPVPRETIENAYTGYDADVYTVNANTGLRETATEAQVITYPEWVSGQRYDEGSKVSRSSLGRNFRARVPIENQATTAQPEWTYSWEEIARYSGGPNILVTLPAGTELYLVESVDSTWYKMSTYYGIIGYVKKTEVTYSHHLSPSETVAHEITEQLFRLREPTVDNDAQTVTITGMHVSYDLSGVLVQDVSLSQASPGYALTKITEAFMIPYAGTIATNLTAAGNGTYTGDIKGKNGMFALLDPEKGLVPYFGAKFTRDNWDLFILQKTDVDRGYRIRYGKNMRGVNWKRSSSSLITRVVPVAKAEDGSDLYLPEKWVDSTHINDYPVILMERLQVKGQVGKDDGTGTDTVWIEANLLNEMRAKAAERFSVDHVDLIAQEVTVQLEQIGDLDEYPWLKDLERVLLYDTVKAIDPNIGLSISLYVTELEYDCIRRKVVGVKLANVNQPGGGNVTGYNVQNNSIGSAKLTDEAKAELIQQALYQSADINQTAQGQTDNLLIEETEEHTITWNSTANPYEAGYISIGKQGYTVIGIVGYVISGDANTYCFLSRCTFNNSYFFYTARKTTTPESTTENKIKATVLYKKTI